MDFEKQITEASNQAIRDKVFPGCIVGIVHRGGERRIFPFGNFTYEPQSSLVKKDTIYDLASITKSIPTASLALQLIDEGKLKPTDKLIDYIPEFANSDRENVLIQHLLTYTLDGYGLATAVCRDDGVFFNERTAADVLRTLLTHNFDKRPGSVFKYTNINPFIDRAP